VPRLRSADRCTLTERFLEVRGDLRTHNIQLGSGNILMAPDDEYLCIVPGRGRWKDPKVYLPFEEDGGIMRTRQAGQQSSALRPARGRSAQAANRRAAESQRSRRRGAVT
jgi:hypothetical protein